MREIKFRGKASIDIDTSGLFNPDESSVKKDDWVYGCGFSLASFFAYVNNGYIDPATVGQCTGLKDSKGVEAYEGDIVYAPLNKTKYEIRFGLYDNECDDNDEPHQINGFFLWAVDGFCESSADINKHGIEIIGNIHEVNNDQS